MAHADFTDKERNRVVIVTYGRIVTEAMAAAEKLEKQGIPCGIILLETLKPYAAPAAKIAALLPTAPAAVLFLEEGIQNGGAGMLTLEALRDRHATVLQNKRTAILAIKDHFAVRTQEESILRTAHLTANDLLRTAVHLLATLEKPTDPNSDQGE